ncbi:lipoate--protein ligase [Aliibacillus thermotolerans]|uniref:lipoate--protein ligase n=1 Tax=Aliibacillus thermotolerans TaxID=1834418 RepID=A0ABW0U431_9BACI|nr:lipoate--protein ligase [Aliibacillus thermotolerans]MDA3128799.1 lipoate--protein ligase [Aliibacillus thermotolerans]
MKFIDNEGITDPRINLAIEEYALNHMDLDKENTYLLFYVNEPSIIIGKNQNTIEEINVDYVEENNIHVVRRLSGGGAVYHDLGNLNFSFLTKDDGNSFHNFEKFTKPIIEALNELGVPATLSGRNDIEVKGKKISGNAQFSSKGRMFSHGTLMLHSEVEHVVKALNVKDEKIKSKGIKSIKSRVANINDFLKEKLTMDEFKQLILRYIFKETTEIPTYTLTKEDWKSIEKISNQRYRNWDWNYGKSPAFDIQRSKKFPAGLVDIRFNVKKGYITDCKIYGDFFGVKEIKEVEEVLIGTKYERSSLQQALASLDLEEYLGPIQQEDILSLLY